MTRLPVTPVHSRSKGLLFRRGESGLALASVLWAVLILSLIATAVAGLSRATNTAIDTHIRLVQTDALLEAGFNRLILALLDPHPQTKWVADGKPREFVFGGETLQLTAWDESGKIDLNFAPKALLAALFNAAGADSAKALALAAAVADWRDPDDLSHYHGAERADYPRGARLPTNRLFQSVAELRFVLGMPAILYCRVAPALTVYSQKAGVNTAAAPDLVLLALAGGDEQRLAELQRPRLRQLTRTDSLSVLGGRTVTLRAELMPGGNLRRELPPLNKEVVVRFTEDARQPVWRLAVRSALSDNLECLTMN